MSIIDAIHDKARSARRRIVLPEGADPRIALGGYRAARDGLADVILLGEADAVAAAMEDAGGSVPGLSIIDTSRAGDLDHVADAYFEARKHKGISADDAREAAATPLVYGQMMVRLGQADGSLAGAAHPSGDVIRTAIQIIGTDPAQPTVSSFFVMVLDAPHHDPKRAVVFADCALVVDPTDDELANIAIAAADNARGLLGLDPKVAMLSFSTKGSARHAEVTKVQAATAAVQARRPDLNVDGDLQFDAAVVPAIGNAKAPESGVAGQANVFVFPNLNAANIGYKIAERFGGATAIGPVLQGLAKPANDLSRGCSADDVYHMIAVTAVQAQALG